MPITTQIYVLAPAAQLVATGSADPVTIVVSSDAAGAVIGGAAVTPTTGLPIPANTPVEFQLLPGDLLYACHATTSNLAILRTRQ